MVEGRGRPEGNPREKAKVRTQRRVALPPNLTRVNEAAKRDRKARFTALLHHVDHEALYRAFRRLRRSASAGVDGETVADYKKDLVSNIKALCSRVHAGCYRSAKSTSSGSRTGFDPDEARTRLCTRCIPH
jgi:RNA-directed DNA polymerase